MWNAGSDSDMPMPYYPSRSHPSARLRSTASAASILDHDKYAMLPSLTLLSHHADSFVSVSCYLMSQLLLPLLFFLYEHFAGIWQSCLQSAKVWLRLCLCSLNAIDC